MRVLFAAVIFQAVIVGPLAASVRSLVLFPSDITPPPHTTQYLTPVSKTHDRSTVVSACKHVSKDRCASVHELVNVYGNVCVCACVCKAYLAQYADIEYAETMRALVMCSKLQRQPAAISNHTHRC